MMLSDRWRAGRKALVRTTGLPPRASRAATIADAVLAVVLMAALLSYTVRAGHDTNWFAPAPVPGIPGLSSTVESTSSVGALQIVLAVLATLPLAVRRRFPLATFWVVLVAALLFHIDVRATNTAVLTFAACLIAAYTAAMYGPYRVASIASLVAGAALIAVLHEDNVPNIRPGYVPFFVLVGIGIAANSVHVWKQRVLTLQTEQEAATRQAVERERARIARELHDVVTHNVAVMVVQAGAARKMIDVSPDQARQAMLAVEAGGRAAMAELRHVMGLLTMSGDGPQPDELAPQPSLDQLPALTSRVREAGVPVELTVTGASTPLPAGVDLAAYRVVQEALTNTVKHAPGARVQISVDYRAEAVQVEVVDSGGTPSLLEAPDVDGNGRGLVGLRERLAVYGGTLHAGARPTGGYRVTATIPVGR
jgi:signal transduction histidine kinase